MQDTIKIGTAALGGYVLGRTRKAKAAIGLALWLTGRGRVRDVARDQAAKLLTSERGQELLAQLRGPVLGAGKQAAASMLESQAGRLGDTLHRRNEKLAALAPTGRAAPAEEEEEEQLEGEEPEEYEDEDLAEEEEEEEPEEELEEGEPEEDELAEEDEYESELEEEEPEEEPEEEEEEEEEYEDEYADEEAEEEPEPERPSASRRRSPAASSRSRRRSPSRRAAERPSGRRSRQSASA